MSVKQTMGAVAEAMKPETRPQQVAAIVTPAFYAAYKVAQGFVERAREKQGLKAPPGTDDNAAATAARRKS